MNAVIRIHHPDLTPEERAYRMEQLKQATINFFREVQHEKHHQKQKEQKNQNGMA